MFLLKFCDKTSICIYLPHDCFAIHPLLFSWNNHNNIWWRVKTLKLLISQIYPASSNYPRLRSEYCLQPLLLKRSASSALTIGDQGKIRNLRPQNTSLERRRNPKKKILLFTITLWSVADKTTCSLLLLRSVTKEISCSQSVLWIYPVTFSTTHCHRKYLYFKSIVQRM
jgi:hypothetical protein